MQWRLQVNRLQELIDQLECKVSGRVSVPSGGSLASAQAHMPGTQAHIRCPLQAPQLEPLHEEDLANGPDSVSLGRGSGWVLG